MFFKLLKNNKDKCILLLILLFIYLFLLLIYKRTKNDINILNKKNKRKSIGIVGYYIDNNIGNQLLKYSMNVILKKYGFKPTLISSKDNPNANNYN